jgi:hypothetical protein
VYLPRFSALLVLSALAACSRPAPREDAAVVSDSAPVPSSVPAGPTASEAPVTGVYADSMRGFALRLPDGVALTPFEDSTRLHVTRNGAPLVEILAIEGSGGRSAYRAAHEAARNGCVMDSHELSGHCPDTLDYEASSREYPVGPGLTVVRFQKDWVLTDSAGAAQRREIGPFWLIEIVEGADGRALLFRRPETGAYTEEEIRAVEEIIASYQEVIAG